LSQPNFLLLKTQHFQLRIAIEQAQNGIPIKPILKKMNSSDDIVSTGEGQTDLEAGLTALGSGTGKPEPCPEMAKSFVEEIERKRSTINETEEEPPTDILTPSLKVRQFEKLICAACRDIQVTTK
jgi:hypothetical protein